MYTGYFNLQAEPFSLTPDPAFLYLSPGHREALAAVQYGLLDRRGFITMIGEVGTGKTTLLYSLLSELGEGVEAAYIAQTTQAFEDLLAALLKDLGVTVEVRSKRALLEALNAHLLRRVEAGGTTALVIDEAQDLSDQAFEELRLLSNFETYNQKLLQIVLVGQPELQERLRQPNLRQLRERVSVRAAINPLSAEEMERYIAHRLERAGGTASALFDRGALRAIVRQTEGIPRRANILCHNALLFTYGRGLPRVTASVAREAIAEMEERRTGWLRGPVIRRVLGSKGPARWTIATATGLALAFAATGLSSLARPPRPATVAAPASATRAPESAQPAADEPEQPPIEAPVAGDAAVTPPPDVEHVAATMPDEVPAAAPTVAAPPAPGEPSPVTVRVPQGATLIGLARGLYHDGGPELPQLFDEVRRLNPQVTDVNVIVAGDEIHLPAPGAFEAEARARGTAGRSR